MARQQWIKDRLVDWGMAHHMIRLGFGVGPKKDDDGNYVPLTDLIIKAVEKYERIRKKK